MAKSSKKTRIAGEIAAMASRAENVSAYFTNKFTVVRPVRRVNVDLKECCGNSTNGPRGSTSAAKP